MLKKLLVFLLFTSLMSTPLKAQTSMGTGTLTQCGGTYLDPSGTGNYANNSNFTQTICAGTAGQCITLQFTAFNLENNWDYLRIYNGTTSGAPLLATLTGTTIPGNITSTTGCLTLVFTSDGSVTSTGWVANVICSPCGSPPPPPPGPIVAGDCSGAVNICTNSTFQVDPNGSGNVVEFTTGSISNPSTNPGSGNSGCLLSGELNSTWMVVNIATSGTLEFSIGTAGGSGCLDWIMWAYNGSTTCNQIINNQLAPIRCNWNANCQNFTGMATPLPPGGMAGDFEPELNVTCGQRYLICLSNYSSQTTSLPLNFFGTATISCSTFTPITVNSATICPGQSATLTAAGGNTYTWSPSTGLSATTGATVTATPATTTSYTVTGTGACGTGTATSTVTVLAANDPACVTSCTATASNTGPYCAGSTIQLNGTGGGTYSWTGPNGFSSSLQNPTIPSATTLATGTYTLTINLNGCIATASTTVTVNALPTVNAGPDVAVCQGNSATLTASGASTYTWSPATFLNTTSGATVVSTPTATTTYTVSGTSAAGCINTDQVIVTYNPLPIVNAGIDQSICTGASVTLSGSGASTYSWSGSVTNGVAFSPAATTTYTVTGTSAAGCINTDQVLVTVNPLPTVVSNDVSVCAGGTVSVTASGANTYSWSPATYLSSSTGSSVTFTAGNSTTYTVTGTSTAGCTSTDPVTVTVLANAPINAGPDVIMCTGGSTVLSASGGSTYNWDNGLGLGNNVTIWPTATTTYTVVGTDATGCIGTDAITVTVNPNPTVNAGPDQTVCAGTAVTLTASGAATYSWDYAVTNGASFTPSSTLTYTVTGTTAAGCTGSDQVIVTVNPIPIVDGGIDQTVCAGTAITLTATGASTYTWTGSVINGTSFTPSATGTYTVTGTSAQGCTSTDNVLVTVNPLPNVNAGPDQSVCDGASVTLTASGASTYTWSPVITNSVSFVPTLGSTTYSVTGTTAAGCTGTDQVIVTVNPNPAPVIQGPVDYCSGNYATLSTSSSFAFYSWSTGATSATINATQVDNPITVTVTNNFGCQGTSPTYTVTENNVITANFSITICQGESAVIHGLTQTTAGTYSQTYATAAGCDSISNVTLVVNALPTVNAGPDQSVCTGTSTTLTATGAATYTWTGTVTNGIPFTQAIGSVTYTVTGTSSQGCINTDDVIVNVNPLPTVNAGPDQSVCAGTAVTLSGSGASTYSWSGTVSNNTAFTPLSTNTYTVTGTDINGCINTDQVLVTVNPIPNVGAGSDLVICSGESVTLSGTGASTYSWDNSVTNGLSFSPTNTATYTVTGTSGAGCTATDQVMATVNQIPNVNAGPDQTVCIGTSVILSGSGASTYSWTSPVLNGVAFTPGVGSVTYTVTGTSASGCINTDQVVVTVNPLPVVNAGPDQSVCAGTAVVLSGSGANTYSWNNNVSNGVSFTPLATNTYNVTGTSVDGCVNTDVVMVTVNPIPTVNAGNDITICENETVILTGSGANTYTWDNNVVNGSSFTPPVGTTTYTVSGTTSAGCTDTDQVNVTVNPIPVVTFLPDVTLGCAPLTVNFTNTTPNSTNCVWTLSNGDVLTGCGTVTSTFTQPGCYDVTLTTTSNGCPNSFTALNLICVEGAPNAAFNTSNNVLTTLNTEVIFTNNTSGANQYSWNFGDESSLTDVENPTHLYEDVPSSYIVTLIATSPLGCVDTAFATIIVNEVLLYYVPNTFTPDNDNFNQTFKPIFTSGFDPYDYNLLIFNRWGEIIFESHDSEIGWDGSYGNGREIELVQDGVYTWKIEFKVTANDERKMAIGHVNILR